MNLIHHVLALAPASPRVAHSENRDLYSFTFVLGCVWLLLLFLSETFRDWNRWLPGGLKTAVLVTLFVIGASAALLH